MASKQIQARIDYKEMMAKFKDLTYVFPNTKINWFPGHMIKGLRQMQHALHKTDCVIEVHDARLPFSGRNVSFKNTITGNRPHILLLNKQDLAFGTDKSQKLLTELKRNRIKEQIMQQDPQLSDVLFTTGTNVKCSGLQSILPRVIELIQSSDRYHRAANPDSNILIIGIPNVGKSSIINLVRSGNLRVKGRALRVGNKPGVTRALETRVRVSDEPLIYLLDTPGIMMPNIKNMDVGMKLAACGTLKDEEIGEEYIVDYLLFMMNRTGNFSYVDYMKLEDFGPQENSRLMLTKSAFALGFVEKVRNMEKGGLMSRPNYLRTATRFLKGFREGHFGPVILDSIQS